MKASWFSKRRLAQGFLAATLFSSSFLTPVVALTQPAAAQSATSSDGVLAVVGASAASLYDAPDGAVLSTLPTGSVVTAIGRTADSQWVKVVSEQGDTGWVEVATIVAFGLSRLPVADRATAGPAAATATLKAPAAGATATATAAPPTPTATPTLAPTKTPTPVPPTATPAPSPTPTAAAPTKPAAAANPAGVVKSVIAVVGGEGAELLTAPGGELVKSLGIADALTVTGRNAATDWLYATTADGVAGWVPAKAVVSFGAEDLPVVGAEAVPAADATPAASATVETPASDAVAADTDAATPDASTTADTAAPAGSTGDSIVASVTLTEARLNIRSGPDASFRVVGKAAPDEALTAIGRTTDGDWVRVERADLPGGFGWVATEFVSLNVPVDSLPVDAAADETTAPATQVAPASDGSTQLALPTPTPMPAGSVPAALPPALAAAAIPLTGPVAIKAQPADLPGRIVYQDGRNNIYIYDLASGDVRWLTNGFDPAISGDGTKVTFVRGGGSDNGVWTIKLDGSNVRQLYGGGDIMRSPKWSPDDKWIVFSRNSGSYKCFDLQPFLGCVSFQTLQGMFPDIPPAVLFKLFLEDVDRLEFPNWGITRINPDGGDFRDINALDSAVAPDWNEAGIVYQSTAGLEVTQDTPEGQTRSVFHGGWDWDPDWAPGGGRILYQSKEGSHWEIFTVNPDGSGPAALTHPETTLVDALPSNVAGAYSPDGQYIVYASNRTADEDVGPWRLWVMNADGSNKRPLPIDTTIEYSFSGDQVASWGK